MLRQQVLPTTILFRFGKVNDKCSENEKKKKKYS